MNELAKEGRSRGIFLPCNTCPGEADERGLRYGCRAGENLRLPSSGTVASVYSAAEVDGLESRLGGPAQEAVRHPGRFEHVVEAMAEEIKRVVAH